MWKFLNINSEDYMVNSEFGVGNSYMKIVITNFEDVWFCELNEEQLIDVFQKSNPSIEAEKETLKAEIKNLFSDGKDEEAVSWNIQKTDSQLKLSVKSTLGSVTINYVIDFALINNKITIVLPLVILVKGMQKQCEYLCNIVKKKDLEITEYKLDGAVLSRRTVATPIFDDLALDNVFEKNLITSASGNLFDLLDKSLTSYLDKIKELTCSRTIEKDSNKICSSSETVNSCVQESSKKKFVEPAAKIEKVIRVAPKLEKPTIRKHKKIVKKLHNL